MKRWMKSIEITGLYQVTVEKLELFATRGNLGIKKDSFGQRLYDGQAVARLFPRQDAMVSTGFHNAMGYLGEVCLAEGQHISVLPTRSAFKPAIPRLQSA